jgi:hypothetical protein
MSRGASGRIVLEIDPQLKSELHAAVALDGRSLKDWFLESARAYVLARGFHRETEGAPSENQRAVPKRAKR